MAAAVIFINIHKYRASAIMQTRFNLVLRLYGCFRMLLDEIYLPVKKTITYSVTRSAKNQLLCTSLSRYLHSTYNRILLLLRWIGTWTYNNYYFRSYYCRKDQIREKDTTSEPRVIRDVFFHRVSIASSGSVIYTITNPCSAWNNV